MSQESYYLKFGSHMSRVGEKQIGITQGIQVTQSGKTISIKGSEGELILRIPAELEVKIENRIIKVKRKKEEKRVKALHGLYRALIANAIQGVEKPWQKKLEIVGTGYNVRLQGEDLALKVGYSHPVIFKKVDAIKFQIEGNDMITISGVDKQLVGQVAHQIKIIRKPDVYKGKGIKYQGERLRIKPGKKAKTADTV